MAAQPPPLAAAPKPPPDMEAIKQVFLGGGGKDGLGKKKKKKGKDAIPKLDKIAIKKMKPAMVKEALKERGLDIQGNAKVLTQRLLDYENDR